MVPAIRNISYILILAAMLVMIPGLAQDLPRETLSLHIDRNYYLAGDRIFFAVYCTEAGSGFPSRISVLANIELINQKGEIIAREKIILENGSGGGSMHIPEEVSSGEHLIRSYTSWMKNFGPGIFHYTPILIIHPAKKYRPLVSKTEIQDSIQYKRNQTAHKNPGVQISGMKESYRTRDTIAFTLKPVAISGTLQKATISVSIARSGSQFHFPILTAANHFGNPPGINTWDDISYMPDMKGVRLIGRITRPGSGEAVGNRNVLLSFIDSITDIYSVTSDADGGFQFDLRGLHGRRDMIIQVPGEDQNILISIDPDNSLERIPEQAWACLNKDGLEDQYRDMLMEKQLSSAYGLSRDHPGNNSDPPPGKKNLPFYGESDHAIIMGDYIKLPVMEEVFRELGKRVFLSRNEGKYKVQLLDIDNNRIIGDHPYFFIDGIPFFDSEKLLAMDPSSIKSISLKSRKYFMGGLIMDGIIDIRSKKGDAALVEFPRSAVRDYFQGFQHPLPSWKKGTGDNDRIPLYKTTLLFESQIETGPGKSADFKLIAPDSGGRYTLSIRGITNEGLYVQNEISFQVN